MVILIAGASHTGKTVLAQGMLEKLKYPYLSMDHLKMGLIRSGNTPLTVFDDEKLTEYLWPIVREMVKTAIENGQNLIVEGCYIPFGWQNDFGRGYLEHIRECWLVMSEKYIRASFGAIKGHANDVERRLDDSGLDMEELVSENRRNLQLCREHGCRYMLIDNVYPGTEDVMKELGL